MRGFKLSIVLFIIAVGFAFQPGPALGVKESRFSARPYNLYYDQNPNEPRKDGIHYLGAVCFDVKTRIYLDCGFEAVLQVGGTSDGGHKHGGRPLGGLRLPGDTGNGSGSLIFNTGSRKFPFEYVIPEVSGAIVMLGTSTPPPKYFCIYPSDCLFKADISVGVFVAPLTVSEFYGVVLGASGMKKHPESTFAKPNTITMLQEIAKEYYLQSDSEYYLSINDLSLPEGGMFDLNGNWYVSDTQGHVTHRTGTDADINRAPLVRIGPPHVTGSVINCGEDFYLKFSVWMVAMRHESGYPILECEDAIIDGQNVPDALKHIDFD